MQCPECQFDNPAEAKFCNECGSKLDISCPNCSNVNPAGSKFCNECGHNLSLSGDAREPKVSSPSTPPKHEIPDSTSVPEGERRQATVVFSDLSGYTSLNEQLDPEEVEAVMSRIKHEAVLSQSLEHLMLPDTVQSVIRARLDRLDHFSRESLRLASVIGREFAQRILEQISSSRERLSRSLEELKVMGV